MQNKTEMRRVIEDHIFFPLHMNSKQFLPPAIKQSLKETVIKTIFDAMESPLARLIIKIALTSKEVRGSPLKLRIIPGQLKHRVIGAFAAYHPDGHYIQLPAEGEGLVETAQHEFKHAFDTIYNILFERETSPIPFDSNNPSVITQFGKRIAQCIDRLTEIPDLFPTHKMINVPPPSIITHAEPLTKDGIFHWLKKLELFKIVKGKPQLEFPIIVSDPKIQKWGYCALISDVVIFTKNKFNVDFTNNKMEIIDSEPWVYFITYIPYETKIQPTFVLTLKEFTRNITCPFEISLPILPKHPDIMLDIVLEKIVNIFNSSSDITVIGSGYIVPKHMQQKLVLPLLHSLEQYQNIYSDKLVTYLYEADTFLTTSIPLDVLQKICPEVLDYLLQRLGNLTQIHYPELTTEYKLLLQDLSRQKNIFEKPTNATYPLYNTDMQTKSYFSQETSNAPLSPYCFSFLISFSHTLFTGINIKEIVAGSSSSSRMNKLKVDLSLLGCVLFYTSNPFIQPLYTVSPLTTIAIFSCFAAPKYLLHNQISEHTMNKISLILLSFFYLTSETIGGVIQSGWWGLLNCPKTVGSLAFCAVSSLSGSYLGNIIHKHFKTTYEGLTNTFWSKKDSCENIVESSDNKKNQPPAPTPTVAQSVTQSSGRGRCIIL